MTILQIESATIEPVDVTIKTVSDPTGGGALPSFQATAISVTTPAGTWVDGSWSSTWSATTTKIDAVSPTLGATGAGIVVAEGHYVLWIKWGTVVKSVGRLVVS